MHVFGLVEEEKTCFSFLNQRDLCLWLFPEQLSGKRVRVFHDIVFNEVIKFWIDPAINFLFVDPDQAGVREPPGAGREEEPFGSCHDLSSVSFTYGKNKEENKVWV